MLQTSTSIILNLWYSHSNEWSSFSKLFYFLIHYLSPCFRFKKSCGISCWHTEPNKPVISSLSVFFLERMIFPAWKSEQFWKTTWIQIMNDFIAIKYNCVLQSHLCLRFRERNGILSHPLLLYCITICLFFSALEVTTYHSTLT